MLLRPEKMDPITCLPLLWRFHNILKGDLLCEEVKLLVFVRDQPKMGGAWTQGEGDGMLMPQVFVRA